MTDAHDKIQTTGGGKREEGRYLRIASTPSLSFWP
jgi:hypothetical protein